MKTLLKKLFLAVGTLILLLAIVSLVFSHFFPPWLQQEIQARMENAGVHAPHLEIGSWGLGHLEFASIRGEYGPAVLQDGSIILTFTPSSLRDRQLDKLFIVGVDLQVHLPFELKKEEEAAESSPPLTLPQDLPFNELFINECQLELLLPNNFRRRYQLQGIINAGPSRRFYLQATGENEMLSLGGEWNLAQTAGHFNLNVQSTTPGDWLTFLPPGIPQPQLESLSVEAIYRHPQSGLPSWLADIQVPGLKLDDHGLKISQSLLEAGITGEGSQWSHLWMSLSPGHITHQVGMLQWNRLSLEATPERIQAFIQDLHFNYPSANITVTAPSIPITAIPPTGFPTSGDLIPNPITAGPVWLSANGKQWNGSVTLSQLAYQQHEDSRSINLDFRDGAVSWMKNTGSLNGIAGTGIIVPQDASFPSVNIKGTFTELVQGQIGISQGKWEISTEDNGKSVVAILTGSLLGGQANGKLDLNLSQFSSGEATLQLHHIDLEAVCALLPDLQLKIQGRSSGKLAATFQGKHISIRPGFLELDPDSPCHLSYTQRGWLTQDPQIRIEDLLEKMEIYEILQLPQGGSIITEAALRDLDVNKLRMDLFAEDQPNRPILIQIEGTSTLKGVVVPIVLNIPVRGTLEELLDLLLNIDLGQLAQH